MLSKKCFSKKWIDEKRVEFGPFDPVLLEKCIYAFELLSKLAQTKLPFIFKGGTSLILLQRTIRRFSTDIDISMPLRQIEYEPFLKEIGAQFPFVGFAVDDRGFQGLPKRAHFKFLYHSVISKRTDFVLLDVLLEKNLYPRTRKQQITTPFIETEISVSVKVPTLEGLLGDKLTAFAPNTIGVPYSGNKSMQIIKQLFDIGELFLVAENLNEVRKAYHAIFKAENGYHGHKFEINQTLADTIETSIKLSGIGLKGFISDRFTDLLRDGISKITSHLINTRFRLDEAKIAASRAGLLAALIKKDDSPKSISMYRFGNQDLKKIASLKLPKRLEHLEKIRNLIPEAFHNWWAAGEYGQID
jgi:hypothetical protein